MATDAERRETKEIERTTAAALECLDRLCYFTVEAGAWATCNPEEFLKLFNAFGGAYRQAERGYFEEEEVFLSLQSQGPEPVIAVFAATNHEMVLRLSERILQEVLFSLDFDSWRTWKENTGKPWQVVEVPPADYSLIRGLAVQGLVPLADIQRLAVEVKREGAQAVREAARRLRDGQGGAQVAAGGEVKKKRWTTREVDRLAPGAVLELRGQGIENPTQNQILDWFLENHGSAPSAGTLQNSDFWQRFGNRKESSGGRVVYDSEIAERAAVWGSGPDDDEFG